MYTIEDINNKFIKNSKPHIKALCGCNVLKDRVNLLCEKHNYTWDAILDSALHKKYTCPLCAKEGIIETKTKDYNLWNINSEIAQLLENPNDAIGTSNSSKKKLWFICPCCHNRLYKSVACITKFGLACNICSDGFSYPNKLMYYILNDINIDFEAEFSPEWISPKRYDFCIESLKLIIEMDGNLGHGKKVRKNSKVSLEESLQIDLYKNQKAIEHGYNIIRINSDQSNIEYIKNNILTSELIKYLSFDNVNWNKCNLNSQKSILYEVCSFYNNHSYYSYKMLSKKFKIHKTTIGKYLKIGAENNLCPKYLTSIKPILCLDSNKIFRTASECGRYYNIDSSLVIRCCKEERNTVKGLHFIYLDDYVGNVEELHEKEVNTIVYDNKRRINLYDKNFQYVTTYESISEAARENNTTLRCIIKSCKSKHRFNLGKTYYYADDINQPDKSRMA